ncbi:uncharacterized protein LOC124434809 [Xenia sp. Carnegie-2017]|uniref:uncharacterized protein LOC124434809 n=1 Tax=Xenia sp. Carnegie-2017 TaxID=2897299 RepID=UPI001F03F528|nr:uncharacterized protein LOC124434809 [Xenia sp. Carnegie-2017]
MKTVIVIRMIFVTSFLALQCCHNNSEATSFEIERGELDTFKNIKCTEQGNCKERQCEIHGANCVKSKNCTRCQCEHGRGTFLSTNGDNTYNCTKDQDIIPESALRNKRFPLMKRVGENEQEMCVESEGESKPLAGKPCSSAMSQQWVSLNRTKETVSLMNVKTLQCMHFIPDCEKEHGTITSGQCKNNSGYEQEVMNENENEDETNVLRVFARYCRKKINVFMKKQPHSQKRYSIIYSQDEDENEPITWHYKNNSKTIIKYKGCYRFFNSTFMYSLVGKSSNGMQEQAFYAPLFQGNATCRVNWSESKQLNETKWRKLTTPNDDKLIYVENNTSENLKILKVQNSALPKYQGYLMKLVVTCESETTKENLESESHCLLLKFPTILKETTSTTSNNNVVTDHVQMTTSPVQMTTSPVQMTTSPVQMTTSPVQMTTSPVQMTTSPVQMTTSPVQMTTSPVQMTTSPVQMTTSPVQMTTSPVQMTTSPVQMTTSPTSSSNHTRQPHEEREGGSSQAIVIAVSVSIATIVLMFVLFYFVWYRKHKRNKKSPHEEGHLINPTYQSQTEPEYVDPLQVINDTGINTENDQDSSAKYEYIDHLKLANLKSKKPEPKYECVDNTEMPQAPDVSKIRELKYDYATDEIPRLNLKPTAPDVPTEQELKYDYATDEIPRLNLTKPGAPFSSKEQEPNYDYANSTPTVKLNSQTPSSTLNSPSKEPAYHTLEEPNPSPYYSTIENDDDKARNTLLSYEQTFLYLSYFFICLKFNSQM